MHRFKFDRPLAQYQTGQPVQGVPVHGRGRLAAVRGALSPRLPSRRCGQKWGPIRCALATIQADVRAATGTASIQLAGTTPRTWTKGVIFAINGWATIATTPSLVGRPMDTPKRARMRYLQNVGTVAESVLDCRPPRLATQPTAAASRATSGAWPGWWAVIHFLTRLLVMMLLELLMPLLELLSQLFF